MGNEGCRGRGCTNFCLRAVFATYSAQHECAMLWGRIRAPVLVGLLVFVSCLHDDTQTLFVFSSNLTRMETGVFSVSLSCGLGGNKTY